MAQFSDPLRGTTGVIPRIRYSFIAGGAAGNHTLTGIDLEYDRLLSVQAVEFTLSEGAPNTVAFTAADLTSEFSITADDTINNTGGTASSDGWLFVVWEDHDWGEESEPSWQA